MKYLEDRYSKGTAKVHAYMQTHQRYVLLNSLTDALPDYVEKVAELGGQSTPLGHT